MSAELFGKDVQDLFETNYIQPARGIALLATQEDILTMRAAEHAGRAVVNLAIAEVCEPGRHNAALNAARVSFRQAAKRAGSTLEHFAQDFLDESQSLLKKELSQTK